MSARELPESIGLPLRLYRMLGPLLAVVLLPSLFLRLRRRGGWRPNFEQRFGWFLQKDKDRLTGHSWTWIHSISVGETLVALKLARALQEVQPSMRIALSVTTSTGYAIAEQATANGIFVMYNPVDFEGPVSRCLDLLRPARLILIEGEIWPNLVSMCFERGIPVCLANARLSPRSARRFTKWRRWCEPFFQLLQWISIPDPEEIRRWECLGIPSDRLKLTGSIKFDEGLLTTSDARADRLRALMESLGGGRLSPILVAGSTHEGEEEMLVQLLPHWRRTHATLKLILVPRHVERVPDLLRRLRLSGLQIVLRSELEKVSSADVILVDSTGELRDWYKLATVVFVGKSLTANGGQNPVEPARLGKAVVFGPHMENFEVVVKHLLDAKGAIQIRDKAHLGEEVSRLLESPDERRALGENACEVLQRHQGAARRTAELILGGSY